jgi:hypothetical protein
MRAQPTPSCSSLGRALACVLPNPLCAPLRAAHKELHRALTLAFSLATTHRRPVTLQPIREPHEGHLSVRLPMDVRWGRPAHVPLPPDLANTGWRGGRPRPITVMPHRAATANVWFLHHGREALCLRLGLKGQVEILRYRPLLATWTRA